MFQQSKLLRALCGQLACLLHLCKWLGQIFFFLIKKNNLTLSISDRSSHSWPQVFTGGLFTEHGPGHSFCAQSSLYLPPGQLGNHESPSFSWPPSKDEHTSWRRGLPATPSSLHAHSPPQHHAEYYLFRFTVSCSLSYLPPSSHLTAFPSEQWPHPTLGLQALHFQGSIVYYGNNHSCY